MEPKPDDHTADILLRPRAAYALTLLLQAKKPMSATEFSEAMSYTAEHAARLRAYLASHGLIQVQEKRLFIHVSLTEKGRQVAQALLEVRKGVHGAGWADTDPP